MIQSFTALQGQTLYDLCIKAYGDMRGLPYLLDMNPNLLIDTEPSEGLIFNLAYQDFIDFGTGKAWIDVDEFEIEVKVSDLVVPSSFSGIIGQSAYAAVNSRWCLGIISSGGGRIFFNRGNTSSIGTEPHETDFYMPFVSDGIIKVRKSSGSGLYEMLLNDVVMATYNGYTNGGTAINSAYRLSVMAYNNISGTSPLYYGSGTIHYAKITSFGVTNTLNLNEGSGDTVTWSEGDVGTITTSNVNGITYINDTMWGDVKTDFQGELIYYDDSIKFRTVYSSVFLPERTYLNDYLVYEGQTIYDLAIQLYGDLGTGMQEIIPVMNGISSGVITQGTLIQRKVPVSTIAQQFNDNNTIIATQPYVITTPLIDIFDYTFDYTFN